MDNMNIQTISEPADFLKNLYVTAFIMKDNQAEKRPNMYLSEMLPAVVGIEYEDLDDYIRFFDKTIYQYQQEGECKSDTLRVYFTSIESLRNYEKSSMIDDVKYYEKKRLVLGFLQSLHQDRFFLSQSHYRTFKGCIRHDKYDDAIKFIDRRIAKLAMLKAVVSLVHDCPGFNTVDNLKSKYEETVEAGVRLIEIKDFSDDIEQISLISNVIYVLNIYKSIMEELKELKKLRAYQINKNKYRGIGLMDKELLEKLQPIYYVYTFSLDEKEESK